MDVEANEAAAPLAHERRKGPLAGVRVVDLTHMLSGPYCTWILAELGCDVIKVERPGQGDFSRRIAPFAGGASLYFQSINRGKRSIALDLKSAGDRTVLLDLVAEADILVENNRPGAADRLGLGYAALAKLNPRLVYASISGFGQDGPDAGRPAFDAVIQAMSGLMSITGETDGEPTRVGASVSDVGAGLFATIGVLAALHESRTTGRGRQVDVAMLDAQIAMLENAGARYLNLAEIPGRVGSRHPLITPFQTFQTADRPIVVCCDTDEQWRRLCTAIEMPELDDDARFNEGNARTANHDALEPLLAATFRRRGAADWLDRLVEADVPAGPVNTMADILDSDHAAARAMIAASGGGRFVALPLFQREREAAAPAPALDQDGAAIRAAPAAAWLAPR